MQFVFIGTVKSGRSFGMVPFLCIVLFLWSIADTHAFPAPKFDKVDTFVSSAGSAWTNYAPNFVYGSMEANSVTIEGGYAAGYASRGVDPSNTVFDGDERGAVVALVSSQASASGFADGMTLISGLWNEYIYGSGVYSNMENGEITLSNNIITGNAAEERANASISGTVYESNGATPISGGGYVDIYNGDPCKFNYLGATPINASDGTYQFNTLPPGTYYIQTYAYEPYLTEWWASPNSMPLCGNAQPIVLASGVALTDMNFQLDPGAIITGTVFESDGTTPVAGGGRIYAYSGDPCTSGLIQWGRIDADTGAYSINGLGTGDYYIQAQAYGDYLDVWWAEPDSALSCENAQAISVVAGNTVTGKDFQVSQEATLYVASNGQCGQDPCYQTIQLALEAAEDGSLIKVADSVYLESPNWKKAGIVTISGGWKNSFTEQNGLTEIYNPLSTGGGSLKLQPNVKVIAQ